MVLGIGYVSFVLRGVSLQLEESFVSYAVLYVFIVVLINSYMVSRCKNTHA